MIIVTFSNETTMVQGEGGGGFEYPSTISLHSRQRPYKRRDENQFLMLLQFLFIPCHFFYYKERSYAKVVARQANNN